MRNLRKLVLLATTAIAALALPTTTATAQHPGYEHPEGTVELTNEPTGEHCTDFTVEGHQPVGANCTLHATGSFSFFIHTGLSEAQFTACQNEFEAAFNENGEGVIYDQILAPEAGTCGREVCDEAGAGGENHPNIPWGAELFEAPDDGGLKLGYRFCLYAHSDGDEGQVGTVCHIILDVAHVEHAYELSTPPTGALCEELPIEIVGHWVTGLTEEHPDSIETIHLD
ncbi:MAG TPA: hypothetical protein VHH53_13470 [Pseudonocardiaceae bacterium]|nr:hypothetical protein [Pseudonocardiaceae bacterium]